MAVHSCSVSYMKYCAQTSVFVCASFFLCVYVFVAVIVDGSKVRVKAARGGGVEVSAAAFTDSVNAPGAPAGSQRQTA